MAKQDGYIKLKGTIGGISFYEANGVYYARMKPQGITKERIKNDPAFARTRENNSEFGRMVRAMKQLKDSVSRILLNDRFYFGRLTKRGMEVVQGDAVNDRGERNVWQGDLKLLEGFEFIDGVSLEGLGLRPEVVYNRVSGALDVELSAYVPQHLVSPAGASHYKIRLAATEHDFVLEGYERYFMETDYIALASEVVRVGDNFPFALRAGTEDVVCVVMVVQFYQEVNGGFFALEMGDVCSVVFVSGS